MVVWNILLSIFVALCGFGWLLARNRIKHLNEAQKRLLESHIHVSMLLDKSYKEYTDQAVLAHEKMAHEGYENYTTEGKVIK